MKIVILNYPGECVEVLNVSEEEREKYRVKVYRDEDTFDDISCLCDHGFSPDEIHWMVCDNNPDEVPVYWAVETIPTICL